MKVDMLKYVNSKLMTLLDDTAHEINEFSDGSKDEIEDRIEVLFDFIIAHCDGKESRMNACTLCDIVETAFYLGMAAEK